MLMKEPLNISNIVVKFYIMDAAGAFFVPAEMASWLF
jgi:hypothetical protein